jgi:hypothetical protein
MCMNVANCQRCGGPTNGTTTMSMFNEDIICMTCKEKEKQHPEYKRATDAEISAVRAGNYNFKGIGLPK